MFRIIRVIVLPACWLRSIQVPPKLVLSRQLVEFSEFMVCLRQQRNDVEVLRLFLVYR